MGQLLSNPVSNSLVKLAENNKPTRFIRLDNDHYGAGTGVTLICKGTFGGRQWEASYDSGYNDRYIGCLLGNFCDGIWPLKLDEKIRGCLVPILIVAAEGDQVATLHTIYRRGFALSCAEAGMSDWQAKDEVFDYPSDNTKRIACLDETATAVRWGLHSPYLLDGVTYSFNIGGIVDGSGAYRADFTPRPAFNLKSSIIVSDSTDSDGCYMVESVPGNNGGLYVKNNGLWVKVV